MVIVVNIISLAVFTVFIRYTQGYATLAFTNYPLNAQQCLYNAADASGCPTVASYSQDINSCLCGNEGNFVTNSALCVRENDSVDLQNVWSTMVYDCQLTGTPLQYSESAFLGTGSTPSSPVASSLPQLSSSIPPSPSTGFITSKRVTNTPNPPASPTPATTTIMQGLVAGTQSTTSRSASTTTTSTSDSTVSNGNNVGHLSGGMIGLIGACATVAALVIAVFMWCGCFKGKRSCKWGR